MTWYFQKVVKRDYFIKHPKVFQCLMIFYWAGFGVTFLAAVSRVESHHGSKIWWTLGYTFCNLHHYLIGDLMEDMIYRDLGCLGGLWHNWGTYGAPLIVLGEVFAITHLMRAHEFGVFRDPSFSIV